MFFSKFLKGEEEEKDFEKRKELPSPQASWGETILLDAGRALMRCATALARCLISSAIDSIIERPYRSVGKAAKIL